MNTATNMAGPGAAAYNRPAPGLMIASLTRRGVTLAQIGRQIGLHSSSICRLRSGDVKSIKSDAYEALFALYMNTLTREELSNDRTSP